MQIKLRVRVNDVAETSNAAKLFPDGFIHFDNCTQVKYGKRRNVSLEEFRTYTGQWDCVTDLRKNTIPFYDPHDELIVMVRDVKATEARIAQDPKFKDKPRFNDMNDVHKSNIDSGNFCLSPYHVNVIEWIDRVTGRKHLLVYDTVAFLTQDNGDTIRKIEG